MNEGAWKCFKQHCTFMVFVCLTSLISDHLPTCVKVKMSCSFNVFYALSYRIPVPNHIYSCLFLYLSWKNYPITPNKAFLFGYIPSLYSVHLVGGTDTSGYGSAKWMLSNKCSNNSLFKIIHCCESTDVPCCFLVCSWPLLVKDLIKFLFKTILKFY